MAFTLPDDLPENWVDGIGMVEDADYLNDADGLSNDMKAALLAFFNGATSATVATSETTTSASFVDLATTTDTVTVTIGASGKALVLLAAGVDFGAGGSAQMSYALSGANTRAASTAKAIGLQGWVSANIAPIPTTGIIYESGLAAGSTTFKAKYSAPDAISVGFVNRTIAVIPFP